MTNKNEFKEGDTVLYDGCCAKIIDVYVTEGRGKLYKLDGYRELKRTEHLKRLTNVKLKAKKH